MKKIVLLLIVLLMSCDEQFNSTEKKNDLKAFEPMQPQTSVTTQQNWTNTVMSTWPAAWSRMGWELGIHFHKNNDFYVGNLDVYVAEVTSTYQIIGNVYKTTTTDFNPFKKRNDNNQPAPHGTPSSLVTDLYSGHESNWYGDFEQGAPAAYYAPLMSEDKGYLIWVETPSGKGSTYNNAIYVNFSSDGEDYKPWDSFASMDHDGNGFTSWYRLEGQIIEAIDIRLLHFIPPTFPTSPSQIFPGNNYTQSSNIVYFSWNPSIANPIPTYDLWIDGSIHHVIPTFTSLNIANGSHTWKVRAKSNGLYSDWSSTRNFTIQAQQPLTANLAGVSTVISPVRYSPSITKTWTGSATNGTVPYTYKWYRTISSGSRILVSSSNTYTDTFYYNTIAYNMLLELEVRDNIGSLITKSQNVSVTKSSNGGPGEE
jgi:hypothetical protein